MREKEEEILIKFLKKMPLVLALPRANECLAFKQLPLRRPILDFGCGDGLFAQLCFGKKAIEVGLDADLSEIKIARKNGVYQKAIQADGASMPFKKGSFQTVIANSSLEHIKGELNPVLKEINRVLKKGGSLILTVPRPVISDYLFFSRIFGKRYIDFKQNLWKHYHLLEKQGWQKELEKAGFKVKKVFTLIPQEVVMIHDIFYVLGAPYVIQKRLFGANGVFRPQCLAEFLAKRLVKYCRVFEWAGGTTSCIKAIKHEELTPINTF